MGFKVGNGQRVKFWNDRKGRGIALKTDPDWVLEEVEAFFRRLQGQDISREVEFEEKARSLHEDITKHWIKKELSRLQNLIDRANEKGCRSEYPLLIYCNITIYAECYYRMFML
ncbi:hypothetical protein CK203_023767 [Vitis vinifera]|uniref:NERD domain-containing protein n=1 Tax=Vitis vinifera TaxID=29760 RepID=A0A438J9X7_VITVI|nr:hypothetical protein CK203_023767 [Vitis vinifera]